MTELTQQILDKRLLPDYITPEQRNAITSDGGGILVSASAGSGKTFVLSLRVAYILAHRDKDIWADQLLVVTFTRAAAGEMKKRIARVLSDLAADFPDDEKIRQQQLLFPKAKIMTIDAFCIDLLREHFDALGFAPDFSIADEVLSGQMEAQILDELFEREYEEQNEDFLKLSAYFSPKDDSKLRDVINLVFRNIRTHPFPLDKLDEYQKQYESDMPFSETIWGKEIISYSLDTIKYAKEMYENGLMTLENDFVTYTTMKSHHMDVFGALDLLLEQMGQENWDSSCKAVNDFKFPAKSRKKKPEGFNTDLLEYEEANFLSQARKMVNALKKDYFSYSEDDIQSDMREQLVYIQKLFSIIREFYQGLHAYKLKQNRFDFLDLEHAAMDLLISNQGGNISRTPLGDEISKKISMILVDEAQDINHLNETLFQTLSDDGKNIFMVGDVKQSIYSFRQASPELFLERRNSYNPFSSGEYPANISLAKNFRSRPEVTNCVNYVFSQIMSEQIGGLDYNDDEMLISDYHHTITSGEGENSVFESEFHIVNKEEESDKDPLETEAEYIANLIYQMHDDGFIVKGDNGTSRPCCLSDFVILMRAPKGKASVFAQKLMERGLDAWTENTVGYFRSREVSLMINLLKTIDNPLQDIPLMSVLISPMFGFTVDDLAQIRLVNRTAALYSCIQQSTDTMPACAAFIGQITELRNSAALLGIEKLIQKIYDETLIFALFGAGDSGEQKLANLRLLQHYAASYTNSHGKGLPGFLRYIEKAEESKSSFDSANIFTEESSAVRIMSIHKSKGLEFPICIIAGCSGRFNTAELKESVRINSLGITMKHARPELLLQYPTMPYKAAEIALRKSTRGEEMRILYVAMTRAKEKLIMTAVCEDGKKLAKKAAIGAGQNAKISRMSIYKAMCFSDWVAMGLIRHKDMGQLRGMADADIDVIDIPNPNAKTKINLGYGMDKHQEIVKTQYSIEAKANPECLKLLEENLSYEYKYHEASLIPTKLSVTQISNKKHKFHLNQPDFNKKKGLTAAEKGTATHEFIQFANFEKAAVNLDSEINRLVGEEYITQTQADNINRDGLKSLFSSPLMDRMKGAQRCYREMDFLYEVESGSIYPEYKQNETVLVQGIADCVIEEADGIIIVDYKTDRADESQLKKRYMEQLRLYAKALTKVFAKPIKECIIYSIYLKKEVQII